MRKLRAGQCGVNRAGRRACVIPKVGIRLVRRDFDAAAEGFEEVEVPEQPAMIPAPEGASGVGNVEDVDDELSEAQEAIRRRLEPVFLKPVRQAITDAVRDALTDLPVGEDSASQGVDDGDKGYA